MIKLPEPDWQRTYLPAILFALAIVPKLFFITSRDISLDEPFTLFHAQFDLNHILKLPAENEPNPPLYMILLHFWIAAFGIGAFAVRLLPLLFHAFTTVVVYQTGRKFFTPTTGLLASFFLIASTYHFYFALESRTYSLLALATACSLYFFLSVAQKPANRLAFAGLIISNAALLYSHYFGWFIVFVQFACSYFYYRDAKTYRSLVTSTIVTGLLFLPLAPVLVNQFLVSGKGTWVQPPSKSEYLSQLYWFANSKAVFWLVAAITAAGIAYRIWNKQIMRFSKESFIVFAWWFIPFTVMFAVSFKVPMFINRYILFTSVGFYLVVAMVVCELVGHRSKYLAISAVALLFLSHLQINARDFYWREVGQVAQKAREAKTGNSMVIVYPHWADLGFAYYYNSAAFTTVARYDSLMKADHVFPVWNADEAAALLAQFPDKRVVYVQDGQLGDYAIYGHLKASMCKVDSVFYPECFHVVVFDPLPHPCAEPENPPGQ